MLVGTVDDRRGERMTTGVRAVLDFDRGEVLTGREAADFNTEGVRATTSGVGSGPRGASRAEDGNWRHLALALRGLRRRVGSLFD